MIVFFYRKVQLELRNLNLHLSTKFSIRESFKRQLLKHSPYSRISAQSTGVSFTGNQPSLFSFLESTPTENNFQCILCIDVFSQGSLAFPLYMVQHDCYIPFSLISPPQLIHMENIYIFFSWEIFLKVLRFYISPLPHFFFFSFPGPDTHQGLRIKQVSEYFRKGRNKS